MTGPRTDADVPGFVAGLGLPGIVDVHVHFLPENVLRKVWAYFDRAAEHYGTAWPVHYRLPEAERVATLEALGVTTFAPLVYPHRPGMARWLTEWVLRFAAATPGAVPTATLFPEPDVADYLGAAVAAGARVVKVHVQVGGFDPRDPLLTPAWGLLAEAGVPVVVHCGDGPLRGAHTGLDVFAEVLAAHPGLRVVLAHAGLPDYGTALDLLDRYPHCHLDTTMVGTPFTEAFAPLPRDWAARLVAVADRVVFGSDFPNIPYAYAEQVRAVAAWAAADDRLGPAFLRSVLNDAPARLLGQPRQAGAYMRVRDVEARRQPPVGPLDRLVQPAVDRARRDLAHDGDLPAAPVAAAVERLARRHQEDLAQPLVAVRPPVIAVAAPRRFRPGRQAQVEPIALAGAKHAVGRRRHLEARDPGGEQRGRQPVAELRLRERLRFAHLATSPRRTLAFCQHLGPLSISVPIAPPAVPANNRVRRHA